MNKIFGLTASFVGGLSVILGAFGAHALKEKLSATGLQIFETAVKYQFYHALALLFIYLLLERSSNKGLVYSGYCMIAGIVCFSGSLYILCFRELFQYEARWAGPITPLGGLMFVAGWLFLFFSILKYNK